MTANILEVRNIAKALGGGAAKPATQIISEMTLDTGASAMPGSLVFCRNDVCQRSSQ